MALQNQLSDPNEFLELLQKSFEATSVHFEDVKWNVIENRLRKNPEKLNSLFQLEQTGGEPSLLDYDSEKDIYIFCDFAVESPPQRRSLCYDDQALESRKKFKPAGSATSQAEELGAELISEQQYLKLQMIKTIDTKTSSWIKTPDEMRELGGALFGDYRYGRVFFYHNGAESYYAGRGFRCVIRV
ncbi:MULTISPECIES: DUF4256 domain-containing protein [unclassified Leeuwenhoekiella]|uniref:DUF4256 domain-containing protein n=1 Tax=unclassified Leeuwenhoekiella TaxID=2615029 RepID=UPI000C4F1088|nr:MULTISPECIES: DUF4256 domain-containing protein [unclassified Leeuwenhoekiella]MAW95261.1 hypothetical protein [Leeuwenhoekiella sp.]MBA81816.1 hypothetical protein [Leeuwenhoekiella sp.]|tara:strand:- start:2815 stop:3372 length:558 start_codon:yes stop_codon:yes gene_type:complete